MYRPALGFKALIPASVSAISSHLETHWRHVLFRLSVSPVGHNRTLNADFARE
jgi:hypothetical protein